MLSRYECKYPIQPACVPIVRDMIRSFTKPDPYAARLPNYTYLISSLYLDTADLQLYQESLAGLRNRAKLRIRSYSDHPDAPVHLEVKRRIDGIVQKTRCTVTREQAAALLTGHPDSLNSLGSSQIEAADEFRRLALGNKVEPMVRIRYLREAYESAAGDPVRVTFDYDVSSILTRNVNFSTNGPGWAPIAFPYVILEIKYTESFPSWVSDIVHYFGLQRSSISKYVHSMNRAPFEHIDALFNSRQRKL